MSATGQSGQIRDNVLLKMRTERERTAAELSRVPASGQALAGYPDYAQLRRDSITRALAELDGEITRVEALSGDALVTEFPVRY